jgi:hypothetical protein
MGIMRFGQYFNAAVVNKIQGAPKQILLDGSYFWERYCGISDKLDRSNAVIMKDFIFFLFNDILDPFLDVFLTSNEQPAAASPPFLAVFDSPTARGFLKWPQCLKREESRLSECGSGSMRVPFDASVFQKALETFDMSSFLSEKYHRQMAPKSCSLLGCWLVDLDADSAVLERLAPGFWQGDDESSMRINVRSCGEGSTKTCGKRKATSFSSANTSPSSDYIEVGRVGVMTGDSDFLSFFPFARRLPVFNKERDMETGKMKLLLLNYQLSGALGDLILPPLDANSEEVQFLAVTMAAMFSSNDYCTANFFDAKIFSEATSEALHSVARIDNVEERRNTLFVNASFFFLARLFANAQNNNVLCQKILTNSSRILVLGLRDSAAANMNMEDFDAEVERASSGPTDKICFYPLQFGSLIRTAEETALSNVEFYSRQIKNIGERLKFRSLFLIDPAVRQLYERNFKTILFKTFGENRMNCCNIINGVKAWLFITTRINESTRTVAWAPNDVDSLRSFIYTSNVFFQAVTMFFVVLVYTWLHPYIGKSNKNLTRVAFRKCFDSLYNMTCRTHDLEEKFEVRVEGDTLIIGNPTTRDEAFEFFCFFREQYFN